MKVTYHSESLHTGEHLGEEKKQTRFNSRIDLVYVCVLTLQKSEYYIVS